MSTSTNNKKAKQLPTSPLALIVPVYNEESNLDVLISTISNQLDIDRTVVVFVDNNSTDDTLGILHSESAGFTFPYRIISATPKGKLAAIRIGVEYLLAEFSGVTHAAVLDADSYYATSNWVRQALDIIEEQGDDTDFYLYGEFDYHGFDFLSKFNKAYYAYSTVLKSVMRNAAWFGPGQSVAYPLKGLKLFFEQHPLDQLGEDDLKISIFLLANKFRPIHFSELVMTSPRRILKDKESFQSWVTYNNQFYLEKWHYEAPKDHATQLIRDLTFAGIDKFFMSRAVKLASRNILPLMAYDKTGSFDNTVISSLVDLTKFEPLPQLSEIIESDISFHEFASAVAGNPEAGKLVQYLFQEMKKKFNE